IFFARFACIAILAGAVSFVVSFLPSLAGPHPLARMAATCLGSVCVFFAIVALQGVLIQTLPARRFARWSTLAQGLLIAICLLAGLYSWFIREWPTAAFARLRDFGAPAPPVWFFGLYQTMSGVRDPFLTAMARRAVIVAAVSVLSAALVYLSPYARHRRLRLELTAM